MLQSQHNFRPFPAGTNKNAVNTPNGISKQVTFEKSKVYFKFAASGQVDPVFFGLDASLMAEVLDLNRMPAIVTS